MKRLVTFGEAIEALKDGYCVTRNGWNGKNMYISLNKGSLPGDIYEESKIETEDKFESIQLSLFEKGDIGTIPRLPNLNMRAASGSIITGWLASQTDILAEDWIIL